MFNIVSSEIKIVKFTANAIALTSTRHMIEHINILLEKKVPSKRYSSVSIGLSDFYLS